MHGQQNLAHGNIKDPSVVASIHGVVGSSKIVSGGFACQPWSQLGDGRGASDPRASSLVGILEAAYWWRAHSFLLACVCSAGQDLDVKRVIKEFCQLTGFSQSEVLLALACR